MNAYLSRHIQVFFTTLGDMLRTPLITFNTIVVIAITLLLPTMLYVLIKSAQSTNESWQGRPQMSIFLKKTINDIDAEVIFEEIQLHPQIAQAELITPQQALDEFAILSGLDKEIDFLDHNPLPASIVIMPIKNHSQSADLLRLKDQIGKIDGIEKIRLDLDWTKRFNAILNLASRTTMALSAILAIGLVLTISNTVRLIILNRRDEIEITKLVGGTNSFIRRPFLYFGFLLGLFGAILSILILIVTFHFLQQPLNHLVALYGSDNPIYRLHLMDGSILVSTGCILGWLAACLSVARHLREIEPK